MWQATWYEMSGSVHSLAYVCQRIKAWHLLTKLRLGLSLMIVFDLYHTAIMQHCSLSLSHTPDTFAAEPGSM